MSVFMAAENVPRQSHHIVIIINQADFINIFNLFTHFALFYKYFI